jgi:hypothetical protein
MTKMSNAERAATGGRGRAEALTPEERAESARTAARSAHAPATLARRIVKAWPELSRTERAEVREILAVLAPRSVRVPRRVEFDR